MSLGTACTQVKPNDAACIAKARAKCTAAFAKLQHPTKGTVAKLAAKLSKACRVQAGLDLADIGQDNGLGLDRLTPRCQALGNGSQFGLPQCLGGQAYCEGAYMIERQVPRARELSDTLGVVIPGIFD